MKARIDYTTIKISKRQRTQLKALKIHEREPYEDVITRLIEGGKQK